MVDNYKKKGKAKFSLATARGRLEDLKDVWARCKALNAEVETTSEDDDRTEIDYFANKEFEKAEDDYFEACDFFREVMDNLSTTGASPAEEPQGTAKKGEKLPTVCVPSFNGDYSEWPSFRDMFRSIVAQRSDLSEVTKLHHLLGCVNGEALEAIRGIKLTNRGYAIAWETLVDLYESERRQVTMLFQKILEMPYLTTAAGKPLRDIRALVRQTDGFLLSFVLEHLDPDTRCEWNDELGTSKEFPTYAKLDAFLEYQAITLEYNSAIAKRTTSDSAAKGANRACSSVTINSTVHAGPADATPRGQRVESACPLCLLGHPLRDCPKFVGRSVAQRRDIAVKSNVCFNCLGSNHSITECGSRYRCKKCRAQHHTLLHAEPAGGSRPTMHKSPSDQDAMQSNRATRNVSCSGAVLLKTAGIRVYGEDGRTATVRALIDEGSQVTLITEQLGSLLHLRRENSNMIISSAGGTRLGTGQHAAIVSFAPEHAEQPKIVSRGYIVPKLVGLAKQRVENAALTQFKGLVLADSDPMSSRRIDVLIGADVFNCLFRRGVKFSQDRRLKAENTIFGWVLSGAIGSRGDDGVTHRTVGCVTTIEATPKPQLDEDLRRFWEIEEIPSVPVMFPLEALCEDHFARTYSRTPEGRFVVHLPFKQDAIPDVGESRVIAANRFRSLAKKLLGNAEMSREYSTFMREYEELGHMRRALQIPPRTAPTYIPHHPVFRADSQTTRLRVVFDASCRTGNGRSLNECLLPEPKLQADLPTRDVDFQRIQWAPQSVGEPIEFQLLTVTYGMSCAPYLALRVLRELTDRDGAQFPLAAPVLRHKMYVDDVLFGEWAGNSPELFDDIEEEDHGLSCTRELAENERVKILGIAWKQRGDSFNFHVTPPSAIPTTKRAILSDIARLYDPLGWVAPVIVAAKVLLQELWRANVGWDEELPAPLRERWLETYRGIANLREISLPRRTGVDSTARRVELHGFADASNHAYAAVTYPRVTHADGSSIVTLLAGKSRVAPLKPLTIPRRELCAAVLLARLIELIRNAIGSTVHATYCWTDSTVVLAWLRDHPSQWQTFVANLAQEWRHVPTADNPADCASRGLSGHQLLIFALWWNGPRWLTGSPDIWPQGTPPPPVDSPLEEKGRVTLATTRTQSWEFQSRFSSWRKLLRITAILLRFIRRCRRLPPITNVPGNALGADEVSLAREHWLRQVQADLFREEWSSLSRSEAVRASSSLSALNPFLGPDNIIRVGGGGGRLENAVLPFSRRHPSALGDHPIVRLMVENAHQRTLHGGTQLTLCTLRREYWVLRARSLVRAMIHRCVRCVYERAEVPTQLMGQLPTPRSIKTFDHTGVDYAGPLSIRASAGRVIATRKAYIAVFVFLATRAIHLELAADLTTEAFFRAFARFVSRRGMPSTVYSDNGTTFVGADSELARSYRAAIRDPDARNGRVIGEHKLTFEEFATLLCRVKACLNLRTIAPLSDAIDDFDALTPGHFLIGHPPTAVPEPTLLDRKEKDRRRSKRACDGSPSPTTCHAPANL
ncbi:uncharacterized protein LOC143218544 [Lasioglossum baleicum]|uniref:uncharacterized protein LOC143218544 n=1 Tax=Lasioglossum baleicum TaxID=434251 RepID=UPI003FCC3097